MILRPSMPLIRTVLCALLLQGCAAQAQPPIPRLHAALYTGLPKTDFGQGESIPLTLIVANASAQPINFPSLRPPGLAYEVKLVDGAGADVHLTPAGQAFFHPGQGSAITGQLDPGHVHLLTVPLERYFALHPPSGHIGDYTITVEHTVYSAGQTQLLHAAPLHFRLADW